MKKLTKTEIRRTGRFRPQILLAAPWPQMHAFPYEWTSKSAFGCSFLSDLLYHFRTGSHGQGWGACGERLPEGPVHWSPSSSHHPNA